MAKHRIRIPDWQRGQELRSIVWDNEAGTVDGDHSQIGWIGEMLASSKPVIVGDAGRIWALSDPGRDPAEFLVLIRDIHWPALAPPLRDTLPPVFDGVAMSPGEPTENPFGHDAITGAPLRA